MTVRGVRNRQPLHPTYPEAVIMSTPTTHRAARRMLSAVLGLSLLTTAPLHVDAQRTAAAAPLTVDSRWLAAHLRDPNLVLLHLGEKPEYEAGHIPGARFVNLMDIVVDGRPAGLSFEMPAPDDLRARLETLGISNDSRIVVYYGKDWVSPSTRVIFTLHHAGLGDRVSLLDGGMQKWKSDGNAVTADATPAKRGTLSALTVRPTIVDVEYVKSHLRAPGTVIIDARAPVFYDGPSHGEHRAGHIPGAVNIPFNTVFDDSNVVLSRDSLTTLFRSAGVTPTDKVVVYCHIGQQATAVIFGARLLGYDAVLYDGSFDDWSRRTELPVETGPRKPGA
jgi:thiosulfate/3-mercaptopyruvate sulfurtransferase